MMDNRVILIVVGVAIAVVLGVFLLLFVILPSLLSGGDSPDEGELVAKLAGRAKHWQSSVPAGGSATDWESWEVEGESLISELRQVSGGLEISEEMKNDLRAYRAARVGASEIAAAQGAPSLAELARLRTEGMLSGEEFSAFSKRFEASPGKAAQEIVKAIEALHAQHRNGAMSEGNYRAGLWTLLDKLDRSNG